MTWWDQARWRYAFVVMITLAASMLFGAVIGDTPEFMVLRAGITLVVAPITVAAMDLITGKKSG